MAKNTKQKATITSQAAEIQKAKISDLEYSNMHSIVKTSFSLPPYRPELRIFLWFFVNNNDKDPDIYIVKTNTGAKMLSKTLRKAADMIDKYVDRLPNVSEKS